MDLIIIPLFFVGEPDVSTGLTSITIDAVLFLSAGNFSKNRPGILVGDNDNDNNIVFFGLGRNMSNLKPELYGEILISGITEKEIVQSWKNAKDKEESMNLIFEDISGSRLRTMIKQNNWWSPVGRRATIASLSNRSVV